MCGAQACGGSLQFGLVYIVLGLVFILTPVFSAMKWGGVEEWLSNTPLSTLCQARAMIAVGCLMALWGFYNVLT